MRICSTGGENPLGAARRMRARQVVVVFWVVAGAQLADHAQIDLSSGGSKSCWPGICYGCQPCCSSRSAHKRSACSMHAGIRQHIAQRCGALARRVACAWPRRFPDDDVKCRRIESSCRCPCFRRSRFDGIPARDARCRPHSSSRSSPPHRQAQARTSSITTTIQFGK